MKVKLRIGIDVFCGFDILSKENGNSGILTYAQRLIYSLLAINEEEKNDIILFQKKGCTSVHGKNVYMRFVSTKEVLNPRSAEWERCYLA
ncbi:hypothetical protein SAMN02746089_01134 [Caldanaerobius fijiensis DSM 17918]|uniref:Uncharacterized protein n=1 Tax=Caldanaerobius fijiensis DSM 17918 TaxID=1121256 RepID=A0A1M4Y243_9THEO|nr:hypothetical protein [Caldanaerobius fijiensis]SHE99775.1 hypothetical protein SAMN02746089_01134 [Caldanaerobius fijiensis DSM 17918]